MKIGGIAHDASGRAKLYADIAHPVNAACREMIQNRVIEELNSEIELSHQPGYKSRYDDDYDDSYDDFVPDIPPGSGHGKPTTERTDAGSAPPGSPHDIQSQNPDVSSERSEPSPEGFGKGIFD